MPSYRIEFSKTLEIEANNKADALEKAEEILREDIENAVWGYPEVFFLKVTKLEKLNKNI